MIEEEKISPAAETGEILNKNEIENYTSYYNKVFANNNIKNSEIIDVKFKEEREGKTFIVEAPDRGRKSITITETDGKGKTRFYSMPRICGRYFDGEENRIKMPHTISGKEGFISAPITEINKGLAIQKIFKNEWVRNMSNRTLRDLWHQVAELWPEENVSPLITESEAPLAPSTITFNPESNLEDAKKALRELGYKLSPAGRLVIGAALFSPWLNNNDEIGGTNFLVHLYGKAGSGKTMVAKAAASLFGSSKENACLFRRFNSSNLGLSAMAKELSYYPVIIDELNSLTGDVDKQMAHLIGGASRTVSNRNGNFINNSSEWRGLVLSTSNAKLKLKLEMYDRRLCQIPAEDLWEKVPEDAAEANIFWMETIKEMKAYQGWVWKALAEEYPAGPEAAKLFDFISENNFAPLTKESEGKFFMLAQNGCQWISNWVDDEIWIKDLEETISSLLGVIKKSKKNVAKEVSELILEDFVSMGKAWQLPSETYAYEVHGYPVSLNRECQIDHEGSCQFFELTTKTYKKILAENEIEEERVGSSDFKKALIYDKDRLKIKSKVIENRPRVYCFCFKAITVLAEKDPELIKERAKKEIDKEISLEELENKLNDENENIVF